MSDTPTRSSLREKVTKDLPNAVAIPVFVVLGALLVWFTLWAWSIDHMTGVGFGVTAAGLLITLLTRTSSSYWIWGASLAFSTVGLYLVLISLPNLAA